MSEITDVVKKYEAIINKQRARIAELEGNVINSANLLLQLGQKDLRIEFLESRNAELLAKRGPISDLWPDLWLWITLLGFGFWVGVTVQRFFGR